MKIALAGAAGPLAVELCNVMEARGADLLIAGDDTGTLVQLLPGRTFCRLDELAAHATGFDLLVDFSAMHQASPLQRHVNAPKYPSDDLISACQKAGKPRLISVVPLRFGKSSAPSYASDVDIVSLAIPPVYGYRPGNAPSRAMHACKAALFPELNINRLADFILLESSEIKAGPVALADGQAGNRVYRLVKQFIDFGFAVFIVIFFWWLLALVWLLVRLQSPGPGIFAQQRVGQGGKVFTCYKFRTMYLGTEERPTFEVPLAQVTRLGHFLRRSKLDELPQVWNILRNEFSLIGPRPCLPSQAELIEARSRRGVLALKPGISGLSQVEGIEMSDPERLAISDARYLALQSLTTDAKIMFETGAIVLRTLK